MCKFSMLAGEGYKRFGETSGQAVCNVIKRYSRFHGALSQFEVSCLVYRIKDDWYKFYERMEDEIFYDFLKTCKTVKYSSEGQMRGYARRIGAFDSVVELQFGDSCFDDDDVFDLWFKQTIEVNSEYRDTGKFYSESGVHFVDGVFTSLYSHDSFFGSWCDSSAEKEYANIGYSKKELFKKITQSAAERVAERGDNIDVVDCCLCGGSKYGIEGYEKCQCEEFFKDNFWYSRNDFTIYDAAKKLDSFCAKKGIDINSLTPETRKEIGLTVSLSFAVRKFKRKQSGAKKCK